MKISGSDDFFGRLGGAQALAQEHSTKQKKANAGGKERRGEVR